MFFATSTPISDIQQLPPPMVASSWEPLPPLPASFVEPAENLAAAAAQLSDLENEIIARTLLSPLQPSVLQHQQSIGQKMPTNIDTSSNSLPPLFRPPVIDSPPPPAEIISLRRQNSIMTASNQTLDHIPQQQRSAFQRMNSVAPATGDLPPPPYTIGFVSMNDPTGIGDHRDHGQDTCIFARLEQQGQAMASQQYHQRPSATATLVRSSISSNNEGVNNSSKKRTKKMRRSRNIHPMTTHHHQEQQPSEDAGTWASRSASAGSSVDEALYSAVKGHQYEQHQRVSSSQLDTSSDSNAAATAEATASDSVFHISGGGGTETDTQQKQQKSTKNSKTGTLSNAKRTRTGATGPPSSKKMNLPPKASKSSGKQSTTVGTPRPLSSTSSRISQAKADHFTPSSDVVNLNNILLPEENIDEADADA